MEWVMVAVPVALLLLGFPIFVILLTTSAIVLLGFQNVPFVVAHQVIFGSLNKHSLLAVPFFIFAGELMSRGGISQRIVDWILATVGGMRGSLGLTTVGTSTVFGAISGSSPATVAAISRLLYPSLIDKGYGVRLSSGLITSSGAVAIVIPPSIAMILYGASAEQSVALLFIAGIIPGLLIAALMAAFVYAAAARRGIREGASFTWEAFARATYRSAWALGTPVIILGGIYGGITSPTEAAGIACVYAILVTRFIYREVSWRGLWQISISAMYLTAQVFIVVAAAGVFSWLLTIAQIPQSLIAGIEGLQVDPWVVLLLLNLFLLAVGCFLDPASAILVLTPLMVPIAQSIGVDLIHFGIIMTVNLAIGMFTPPFGLNIFVAQALLRLKLGDLYAGLIPFILINLVALLLVTYIPELSLFLTRILG